MASYFDDLTVSTSSGDPGIYTMISTTGGIIVPQSGGGLRGIPSREPSEARKIKEVLDEATAILNAAIRRGESPAHAMTPKPTRHVLTNGEWSIATCSCAICAAARELMRKQKPATSEGELSFTIRPEGKRIDVLAKPDKRGEHRERGMADDPAYVLCEMIGDAQRHPNKDVREMAKKIGEQAMRAVADAEERRREASRVTDRAIVAAKDAVSRNAEVGRVSRVNERAACAKLIEDSLANFRKLSPDAESAARECMIMLRVKDD